MEELKAGVEPEESVKILKFNKAQLRSVFARKSGKYKVFCNIWSRGTGKSVDLGWLMRTVSQRMPGSKWVLGGATYYNLLKNVLPGITASFEKWGMIRDVHFTVGHFFAKKANIKASYEAPEDGYGRCVVLHYKGQATTFQLSTQERGGSRGQNNDGGIYDEALTLDKVKLDEHIAATMRANVDKTWSEDPLHYAQIYASSMPFGTQGKWLLDMEKQAYEDLLKRKKTDIYYDEATVFENMENLPAGYVGRLERSMISLNFRIEVLNERIGKILDGFYPTLNTEECSELPARFGAQVHTYHANYDNTYLEGFGYDLSKILNIDSHVDGDVDPNRFLELSVDWGAKINCCITGQQFGNQQKILKELFVKWPDGLDALADKLCKYYANHKERVVHLYYDRNGNSAVGNSPITYAEQFIKRLQKNNWTVYVMTPGGLDAFHKDKYELNFRVFNEESDLYPCVRINKNNCPYLLISMQNAPIKEGKKGVEKDKKSEGTSLPQEEATHLSDTIDILLFKKFSGALKSAESFAPNRVIGGRR